MRSGLRVVVKVAVPKKCGDGPRALACGLANLERIYTLYSGVST